MIDPTFDISIHTNRAPLSTPRLDYIELNRRGDPIDSNNLNGNGSQLLDDDKIDQNTDSLLKHSKTTSFSLTSLSSISTSESTSGSSSSISDQQISPSDLMDLLIIQHSFQLKPYMSKRGGVTLIWQSIAQEINLNPQTHKNVTLRFVRKRFYALLRNFQDRNNIISKISLLNGNGDGNGDDDSNENITGISIEDDDINSLTLIDKLLWEIQKDLMSQSKPKRNSSALSSSKKYKHRHIKDQATNHNNELSSSPLSSSPSIFMNDSTNVDGGHSECEMVYHTNDIVDPTNNINKGRVYSNKPSSNDLFIYDKNFDSIDQDYQTLRSNTTSTTLMEKLKLEEMKWRWEYLELLKSEMIQRQRYREEKLKLMKQKS